MVRLRFSEIGFSCRKGNEMNAGEKVFILGIELYRITGIRQYFSQSVITLHHVDYAIVGVF